MYHKEYIPVYKAWTQLFTENIEAKLADFLSFRAKKDSLTMLSHRIIALSLDVLQKYVSSYIEQFNPFFIVSSEILPKEDLEKYITDAAKELSKKGMDAFNEEFPLLKEKIIKRCELFISFINEMTQRIIDNKKEISDSLLNGKSFSSITGLSANGADVHNNGQTSVVVHTDAGAFVYKPHDCSSDIIFTKIQNLFFQDIFKTPEVLFVSDKYSFCEFITNKPAATEKNASRYYFNLGGMCAVMTFLGSTDFHEENILANEIYPVPIDLETVFMSRKANRYQSTPEEDFNYSSFKTTMFSVRCIEPEFRESSPLFDISDANVSAPVINGQRQSVFQYQEHFKKGFSEVYTRCLGLKKDLLNIINEKPDMKIRIILKNTNYYSLMSDRLNSYFNMKDNSLHDKCLSELMTYDSEDISKKELSSMENGDIPYFYLALNSRNLYSHNGFCHENFLEISPEEALKTSFDLRNREELEFELTLIDKLIANAINIQNDPEPVVFNTVAFDMQGIGDAIDPITVQKGAKLAVQDTPVAEGYEFGGWFKEAECINAWDYESDTVQADTTLYAKWTKIVEPKKVSVLLVKGAKSGDKAVKLSWNKVDGATKYVVYGNSCGKDFKKLKTTTGKTYTVKKIAGKKLVAHKSYKFYVVAYTPDGMVKSKTIHFITANTKGKYANVKSIKAKKTSLQLAVGEFGQVGATYKMYSGKKHIGSEHGKALRYISDCPEVASVSSTGKILARRAGTATIYIQDVGGKYCKTIVTVK